MKLKTSIQTMRRYLLSDEEKRGYWEVFNSGWQMLKEYADITTNDEQKWDAVVGKANEIGKRSEFARKMVTAVLAEIENRARRKI